MSNTLKQLKRAKEIVDRYLERGGAFPRELRDCGRSDPVRQQEYRDACKIKTWKYSLMGKNRYTCSDEVRDYLDENMPGWRDRVYSHKGRSSTTQMRKAQGIVQRYRERGGILPRRLNDPSREQEYKDAVNLSTWKSSIKGHNRVTCSAELKQYLDTNMPGWREDHNCGKGGGEENDADSHIAAAIASKRPSTEALMPIAQGIVERYQERGSVLPALTATCRQDPFRAREYKDASKLHSWKIHTNEKLTPEVLDYLNTNMPGWKKTTTARSAPPLPQSALQLVMAKAREIVQRCLLRSNQGFNLLPRLLEGKQDAPKDILEQKDAMKLSQWKKDCDSEDASFTELKDYLDKELPGWRNPDSLSAAAPDKHQLHQAMKRDAHVRAKPSSLSQLPVFQPIKPVPSVDEAERLGIAALLELSGNRVMTSFGRSSDSPVSSSPSVGNTSPAQYYSGDEKKSTSSGKRSRDEENSCEVEDNLLPKKKLYAPWDYQRLVNVT